MLRRLPFRRVSSIIGMFPLTPLIGATTMIERGPQAKGNVRKIILLLKSPITAPMRWENAKPIAR
jgi:hypothetical protein